MKVLQLIDSLNAGGAGASASYPSGQGGSGGANLIGLGGSVKQSPLLLTNNDIININVGDGGNNTISGSTGENTSVVFTNNTINIFFKLLNFNQ